ncbi:MAG: transglutaminase-like domain-containing protein, partial [Planctomycetes bacterium]|nr:transglutaminase-like domain-containing protein [Planctomycetota bacterium]
MPTSGGKGGSDPAARQGVGDGDMLVAAKDKAYSFGPVESDLFLESHAPSLYDLFSDLYGEPQKPNKDRTRTIALANETLGDQKHGSETKKKGREFDTLRKSPDRKMESKPKGNDASCLLHVIGESPLLLRQQSYDFFDGRTWTHSEDVHHDRTNATPSLIQLNEKPWIQVASYGEEVTWGIRDRVTVKIINLKSDRVPMPSSTTHVHIDKVDQPDFLGWSKDGQLTMPGHDFIPQLTVMHLLYKTPTLHRLRLQQDSVSSISHSTSATSGRQSWLHRYMECPASTVDCDAMIDRLLESTPAMIREKWTKWQTIEGVVQAMRRRIKIEPSAVPPEDCEDLLSYAFETEVAPDYLVATATACLIRSLGVPCRLATGFYVRPERYDARMRMTEVAKEDLHTWVEVYCHGTWIPVEPSQGYAIPREELTWSQFALESLWWCRTWILTHPWYVLSWLLGIVFLVVWRCSIANVCISALLLPSLLFPIRIHVVFAL